MFSNATEKSLFWQDGAFDFVARCLFGSLFRLYDDNSISSSSIYVLVSCLRLTSNHDPFRLLRRLLYDLKVISGLVSNCFLLSFSAHGRELLEVWTKFRHFPPIIPLLLFSFWDIKVTVKRVSERKEIDVTRYWQLPSRFLCYSLE